MICVWTCTKIQPGIDGFSSLQEVRIPSFFPWSLAGPSLFADDLHFGINSNSPEIRRISTLQGVSIPLLSILVFLTTTSASADTCFCIFCVYLVWHCLNLACMSSCQLVCIPLFLLGLAQQDLPYLLMIFVWTCTKIQPEIDGFASLQGVRIPSFTLCLSHSDQSLVMIVCVLAYLQISLKSCQFRQNLYATACPYPLVFHLNFLSRTVPICWWFAFGHVPKFNPNRWLFVTSARTYPFIYPWTFSRRPRQYTDDFFAMNN